MAGHSKWAKVKHFKGALDAKRGKIFSKLSREITIAAKIGGGDPNMNPRLRMVLLKCRSANMPNDNIERAIKKGTGGGEAANFEDLTYEIYGPNGVALLVEISTDNRNRTASEIRSIRCVVDPRQAQLICEPWQRKLRPPSGYATYAMTFDRDAPTPNVSHFWSVGIAGATSHQARVTSQSELQRARNRTLMLHFAPTLPTGVPDQNWIRTPAADEYRIEWRSYAAATGHWFPPSLRKISYHAAS